MEDMIIKALATGGSGVLAVIIFLMYRRDKNSTESTLTRLLQMDMESRDRHTKAITKLTTTVKRLNGKMR